MDHFSENFDVHKNRNIQTSSSRVIQLPMCSKDKKTFASFLRLWALRRMNHPVYILYGYNVRKI